MSRVIAFRKEGFRGDGLFEIDFRRSDFTLALLLRLSFRLTLARVDDLRLSFSELVR